MKPQTPLQIGLSLTYLYSGFGLIKEPADWLHFVPDWLFGIVPDVALLSRVLQIQGVGELLLGALLIVSTSKPKLLYVLSILGALHVAVILLVGGVDLITFRDIGLLGAWITLALLAKENLKKI